MNIEVPVALLAEGVDRNNNAPVIFINVLDVALLAEGVDRNFWKGASARFVPVALLAEGVDRNIRPPPIHQVAQKSPSSRRAWIEI